MWKNIVEWDRPQIMWKNTVEWDRPQMMWKNIVEWDGPQMTIWRMRIAYWIREATNTHSEYVIPIALPLQQWLYERAFVLRYKYIACLVNVKPHGTYNYHLAVSG
jgi:hypothetical protein